MYDIPSGSPRRVVQSPRKARGPATNNGRLGCGETASNDGGECSEHAEKETEGIRLRRPKIFARLSESASNHENEHISTIAARNLKDEASPERATRGERTAGKARGTVLECARYDERTSRVGRRARLAQQRLGRSTRNSGRR
ncbi:hypothetical protein M404DRAFT_1007883 [Pisolithus tinctorius Marx 270]|uniref:Uncharacterized protein n=1 Tax=Pisolithus tinctorius Marx 270 TaxID=870435 RepID=A0A0C3N1N2_PISTI|nr:hypothetical protein M404DRAFT_1007883 [Pisolithus tinctorius Marx 270]